MKIKNFKEIKKIVNDARRKNKKIVTCNGSFDILHPGHIHLLEQAKKQGDVLIVGLNSDESVKKYKSKYGSILDEKARAKMLSSIVFVDYVVLFDETTPVKFIENIKPNIHVNAAYYGKECVENKILKKINAKLVLIGKKGDYSSSFIINKIIKIYGEKKLSKAIFLDRDNTLVKDKGYTYKIEDFKLMPKVIDGLKVMNKLDYKFFIVTNQSGVGRGHYDEEQLLAFNNHLLNELAKDGIKIEEVYYCPHHPDDGCDCRKPGIVMFEKAKKEHNIDLQNSIIIGDSSADINAGKKLGMKTILVKTKSINISKVKPDYAVDNFLEAANIIKGDKK